MGDFGIELGGGGGGNCNVQMEQCSPNVRSVSFFLLIKKFIVYVRKRLCTIFMHYSYSFFYLICSIYGPVLCC